MKPYEAVRRKSGCRLCFPVYDRPMTLAKDMDDRARTEATSRRRSGAKRAADAVEPSNLDEARRMRGPGWEGDLDEMRAAREFLT